MTEEKELIKRKGTITRFTDFPPTEGKSAKYYLWLDGNNDARDEVFSGFGSCPGKIGDKIEFEYEVNEWQGRFYNNIKKVQELLNLHTEPTEQDKSDMDAINLKVCFAGEMQRAVELCMKRGTLSNEEIKSAFIWMLKETLLLEDYEKLNLIGQTRSPDKEKK